MTSPPVVSCPVVKAGLSSHLGTLSARYAAIRADLFASLQPVIAVRDAYQNYAGDGSGCHGQADAAVAVAEAWLTGCDNHVLGTAPATGVAGLIARSIAEIDCDGPVEESDLHTRDAMTALTILGWWLDARDAELQAMKAAWWSLVATCPVPVPEARQPDEAPPGDEPEGP